MTLSSAGDGVYNFGSSNPVFKNCVIWNNGSVNYRNDSSATISYSIVSGSGISGSNNIASAPIFSNPVVGDYRLLSGSRGVNEGTLTGAPPTDFRGLPRPNGAPGDVVDMGAFENQAPDPLIATFGGLAIGSVITLSDVGSDSDGDAVTYLWTMTSKPGGSAATLSCTTCPSPQFTADVVGSYEFMLVVSDSESSSGPAMRSISIDDSVIVTTNLDEENGTTTSFAALRANPGGAGISLREAILAANNTSGPKTIVFSGSMTITPTTPYLPALTSGQTTIDGGGVVTISGNLSRILVHSSNNRILNLTLAGSNGHHGIDVTGASADNNLIAGCVIRNATSFGVSISNGASGNFVGGPNAGERNVISGNALRGVNLDNAHSNVVEGNYIGTNSAGSGALANSGGGILAANGADANTFRGNVVSGNSARGIFIDGDGSVGNIVTDNKVGTDTFGTTSIPNQIAGVAVRDAVSSVIGQAGSGNLVSGNAGYGIVIVSESGPASLATTVQGNIVGLNASGTQALGNTGGIEIVDSVNNLVGGPGAGEGNLVGGNGWGITLTGDGGVTTGNRVEGNVIGTDSSGLVDLGNSGWGILLGNGSRGNIVGGATAAHGNVIAYNDGPGILASPTVARPDVDDQYRRNRIYANVGKGIRLDDGANSGVTPPQIATINVAAKTVTGIAAANAGVDVYFESEDEGQVYAGSGTADPSGNFTVSILDPVLHPTFNVTATQTRNLGGGIPLHTSEFSTPLYRPRITPVVPNLVTDQVSPRVFDLSPHEDDTEDPGPDNAGLVWSISPNSAPEYTAFIDANDVLTINPLQVGSVVATLTLTDSHGLTAKQNLIIQVGLEIPLAPTVVVVPFSPIETDTLIAVASGGEVQSGATKEYIFEWFRNGVSQGAGAPQLANYSLVSPASTAGGDVWEVVARVFDGADTSADSNKPSVTITALPATNLGLGLSSTEVTLGQSVTLTADIDPDVSNAAVSFSNSIPPAGGSLSGLNGGNTNGAGVFADSFTPNRAGAWTFEAAWNGNSQFLGDSGSAALTVLKAQPTVTLSLAASSGAVGLPTIDAGDMVATATISAPLPPELASLRSGLPVRLFLRKPDGSSVGPVGPVNTDANGVAVFLKSDFTSAGIPFTEPGTWQLIAEYTGNSNFKAATSTGYDQPTSARLTIKDGAGYAVICVGRLPSDEGSQEHNKTGDFVYRALRDRGFDHDDIFYLRQGGTTAIDISVDDASPSKGDFQAALNWAQTRMNASAAPLYVVMLDHGLPEQFFVYSGVLDQSWSVAPTELDVYLTTLEAGLDAEAQNQDRVVVYGACNSGSFVPLVSAPGRIVIASASASEKSHRGALDPVDNRRDGELFTTELFRNLRVGKNLKEAFEIASDNVNEFTLSSSSAVSGSRVQTPMLDDNGDGLASDAGNLVFQGAGDGAEAFGVTLGFGLNAGDAISWIEATQTLSLAPAQSVGQLVARSQFPVPPGSTAWIEVKTPSYDGADLVDDLDDSNQQEFLDLARFDYEPGISNLAAGEFKWQTFGTTFDAPGTYKVYYFVRDGSKNEVSAHLLTTIYRSDGAVDPPTAPVLTFPSDGAIIGTTSYFVWTESTDDDGPVTYTVRLADVLDTAFTNVVVQREGIAGTFVQLTPADGILDGVSYRWRVIARDVFGQSTVSTTDRIVHVDQGNNIDPPTLAGVIYDDTTSTPVSGATVTLTPGNAITMTNSQGAYIFPSLQAGFYNVSVTKTNYKPKSVAVQVNGVTPVNVRLEPAVGLYRRGDVNGVSGTGLLDGVALLNWMAGNITTFPVNPTFVKPAFPPEADVDSSGAVVPNDVTHILLKHARPDQYWVLKDCNQDWFGPDAGCKSGTIKGDTIALVNLPMLEADPGDMIAVPIAADEAGGANGAILEITYRPDVLTYTGYAKGASTANWLFVENASTPGTVTLVGASTTGITGPAELAVLYFTVNEEAAGLHSDIAFAQATLESLTDTIITVVNNGGVTVSGANPADLNGSGAVDSVDIQAIINAILGIGTIPPGADVDGDGERGASDIQFVINRALGI